MQTLPRGPPLACLRHRRPLLLHQGTGPHALTPHLTPRLEDTDILTSASSSVSFDLAQCKLDYQACITGKKIAVKCAGMCPCPAQPEQSSADKKGRRAPAHMAARCKHFHCTQSQIIALNLGMQKSVNIFLFSFVIERYSLVRIH